MLTLLLTFISSFNTTHLKCGRSRMVVPGKVNMRVPGEESSIILELSNSIEFEGELKLSMVSGERGLKAHAMAWNVLGPQ